LAPQDSLHCVTFNAAWFENSSAMYEVTPHQPFATHRWTRGQSRDTLGDGNLAAEYYFIFGFGKQQSHT
jgi:hypothetical protein